MNGAEAAANRDINHRINALKVERDYWKGLYAELKYKLEELVEELKKEEKS